ncbi:MAG: 1-acyl-sn-glycerol-3-phosphate acyltransferase, partial [Bdellovibrionaceae bacterium]|nr:1-acyl-sn-glycerol-3-phosphate acyltransferase [Pseudobdellovibrionaceae bacterium]
GAKIELFKIPVFGFAMRRIGILPIDRRNREGVFRVYREAQIRMQQGERFALAPEGTRQDEERLGPFKSGPFVFAINTGAPVVPVVIRNASQILPKHSLFPNMGTWKRRIRLSVLPAVSTQSMKLDDRPILQEKVRTEMLPFFS